MLTASLSQKSGIALVERENMKSILAEQNLPAGMMEPAQAIKLGQLLKADGLVLLSSIHAGTETVAVARLLAVNTGIVFDTQQTTYPIKDPHAWADTIGESVTAALPKFRLGINEAVKLSVLNFRASPTAADLEGPFSLLLANRLPQQREFFVLERAGLRNLVEEKQLLPLEEKAFAASSYLVSGYIDGNPNRPDDLVVSVVLTTPGTNPGITFKVAGSRQNLEKLIDDTATNITKLFRKPAAVAQWDADAEARRFGKEAMVAYSMLDDDQAKSLAEASIALKPVSPDAAVVQLKILSDGLFSNHTKYPQGYRVPEKDKFLLTNHISRLLRILQDDESNPRYFNGFSGCILPEDLSTVESVLEAYTIIENAAQKDNAVRKLDDATQMGALALAAASIPQIAMQRDVNARNYLPWALDQRARLISLCDRLIGSQQSPEHLETLLCMKAMMSFFWYDSSTAIHDQIISLLKSYPGPENLEHRATIRKGLMIGGFFAMHYSSNKTVKDALARLIPELSSAQSAEDRILGQFFAYDLTPRNSGNTATLDKELRQIYDTLWEMREQIAIKPHIFSDYITFENLLLTDGWSERQNPYYGLHGASFRGRNEDRKSDAYYDFRVRYIGFLCKESEAFGNDALAGDILYNMAFYSEEQCNQIIDAARQRETKFGVNTPGTKRIWSDLQLYLHQDFPEEYPAGVDLHQKATGATHL